MCQLEYRDQEVLVVHHFYDKMCAACADFNWKKRLQAPDMRWAGDPATNPPPSLSLLLVLLLLLLLVLVVVVVVVVSVVAGGSCTTYYQAGQRGEASHIGHGRPYQNRVSYALLPNPLFRHFTNSPISHKPERDAACWHCQMISKHVKPFKH